jgi:ATP-dependent RNA helicase MSS116, mitochondrial
VLIAALFPLRLSFLSYRNFQSIAPLRQEAAAFANENYTPRTRFDETSSRSYASGDYNKRRSPDRQRNPSFRSDNRLGRNERPSDRGIVPPPSKYEVKSYVDEDGNTMQLQDDTENLPEYDSEKVVLNETEAEVKDDQITGYKPTRWLEYRGKMDDGFLESMKTVFRYANLTEVQNTIISRMPLERDLLVRSKTGTGKTIAFLVPAVQRHIDYMKENKLNMRTYPKSHTGVLVISPTRELAMQIASEARRLIFPIEPNGMKVHCLVGGESKRAQIRLMDRERNDIIVATPGRLLDFLGSEPGVKDLLMSIKTLVLDETDSLLDMGFRRDVAEIINELKDTEKDRLTMMFSATISPDVRDLAKKTVKHDVEFVNTVKKDDLDVHQTINQTYIVHDMGEHLKIVLSLIITEQLKRPDGKVIVFFNTTKQVQLYTLMFRYLRRLYYNPHFQQFEIHSRKQQDTRAKVTQAFRTANVGSVLFTSDVSYCPLINQANC